MLAFDFGSDAVGLLRGLDEDELAGTRAAVVNLDYRFPLARIDRGLGTLPAFARVVHGAVFVDAGHAWVERFRGPTSPSRSAPSSRSTPSSATCCP